MLPATAMGFVTLLVGAQFAVIPVWPSSLSEQWQAVQTVATVVIAGASTVGIVALVFLWQQLSLLRRNARVEFHPYLRVDFAPDNTRGSWRSPETDPRYSFALADTDFFEFGPVDALQRWNGSTEVCLWIENQQGRPGGVAHNVVVELELEFPDPDDHDENLLIAYAVILHYVEPARRVRYVVALMDEAMPYFVGRVTAVTYFDMYENALSFAHGSCEFEWNADTLVNRRVVFRSKSG